MGVALNHNEDIMHTFQKFIVVSLPTTLLPVETRIWKLVVRARVMTQPERIYYKLHL